MILQWIIFIQKTYVIDLFTWGQYGRPKPKSHITVAPGSCFPGKRNLMVSSFDQGDEPCVFSLISMCCVKAFDIRKILCLFLVWKGTCLSYYHFLLLYKEGGI